MPRPTTKADMLEAATSSHAALMTHVDSLPDAERQATFAFEDRDRNLRDVVAHLHAWHGLLLAWVDSNTDGTAVPMLPPPYTWQTLPDLNAELWKRQQGTSAGRAPHIWCGTASRQRRVTTTGRSRSFADTAAPGGADLQVASTPCLVLP